MKYENILLFCVLLVVMVDLIQGKEGLSLEYCMSETFNPECKEDEVLEMKSAKYGQLKLGRCLEQNYGHLGCSADILSQLDQTCSGKRSCSVMVVTIQAQLNCTIPKAFTRFLEAKYICKKVIKMAPGVCSHKLKSGRHSMVSVDIAESQCGDETKPLVIEAKSGQKINVTMTDFNWNPIHRDLIGCVQRYGYFIDVDEVVDICGKTKRDKPMFVSQGSSLQLVLNQNMGQNKFLLTFEVSGCPTFVAPVDTWVNEESGVVTVGCAHNDKKWKMRCIGNHWIGIVGKCKKGDELRAKQTVSPKTEEGVFGMPSVVGFSLIGAIFLVILCVMVTVIIGFFCIRKTKPDDKQCYLAPMTYHSTIQGYPTYRSNGNPNTTNNSMPVQQTLLRQQGHNEPVHVSSSPQYFVLEKREDGQKEPIYDAVYQNITDVNSL